MVKAWLILADILLHILLFISLILFYMSIEKSQKIIKTKSIKVPIHVQVQKKQKDIFSDLYASQILDINRSISYDDFLRMGQIVDAREYFVKKNFLTLSLNEALKDVGAKMGDPVFVRIFKEENLLEVWIRPNAVYEHLKDYNICAYSGYLGPKLQEGDRQAPEGFYTVETYQLNPKSKYHLAFNLGYPNAYDRSHNRTGSYLMVHGECASIGCYAMTNINIDEIYPLVENALKNAQESVQVHAFPFRMTEENMADYANDEWYDFWTNLKEGYDYFEAEKIPPHIEVQNKIYTIHEAKL